MKSPREILCKTCQKNPVFTSADEAVCVNCLGLIPAAPPKIVRNQFKSSSKRGARTTAIKIGIRSGKTNGELLLELADKFPKDDRRHLQLIIYQERRRWKKEQAQTPTQVPSVAPQV